MYAFSENYVLPISHDEVVHGKKSFIDKMYGSYEDKFRTARTAMLLLMSYPGKKLLFMGTEYAQFREWDFEDSLEWFMLDYPKHSDFRNYIRELNDFYLKNPPLYELDFSPEGFCWLLVDEAEKCSVAYRRLAADGNSLIFCLNFSNREETLHIKTEECDRLLRVFDTGDGQNDPPYYEVYEKEGSFFADIHLFPLSGIVLKETRDIKKIKI